MNKEEKEAVDILQNCIADYVIGDYCEKCGDRLICEDRNEDCYFQQAIDIVVNLIEKQSKEIEELKKPKYIINFKTNEITTLTNNFISKDKIKEKIDKLEDIRMENLGTQYYGIVEQCENKIEVLQELLKGE